MIISPKFRPMISCNRIWGLNFFDSRIFLSFIAFKQRCNLFLDVVLHFWLECKNICHWRGRSRVSLTGLFFGRALVWSFSTDVLQQFFVPFFGLLENFPFSINSIELFVFFLLARVEIYLEFTRPFYKDSTLFFKGRQLFDIGAFLFIFSWFISVSNVQISL